ncbi:MAG: Hsp70 family protein, partial [Candidatus Thorarchaeota archaeon]
TLGIETLGGVATPLIDKNTTVPTRKSKIFSTAADGQTAVDIHVVQGERPMASQNMTLGKFQLVGIPPAPRGTPQIEVTFDIDANGITIVKAKDTATGNEQSITITASTNLTDDDIARMVKDAEQYAEEDAKLKDQVETRNMADQMIHQGEKLLKDLGEKVPEDLKSELNSKAQELTKALETEDYEKMKTGTEELQQIIYKISEKVYGAAGQGAAGPGAAGFDPSQMGATGPTPESSSENEEDVVDVDFEDLE